MEAIAVSREQSELSYSRFITELVAIWEEVQGKVNEQLFEDAALYSPAMSR